MDFAIFDSSGSKPLMVIETKPLETDLPSKSQQLARYISQMPDLHFGIITDGCHYLFYGDLKNPNQMDSTPFFSFSLDDPKTDWIHVAEFLSKFSRDTFNAETLVTDAENSHYRQAMIDKLANTLRKPKNNDGFLKWLTDDIYRGKRTTGVMSRLAEIAEQAIWPAVIQVFGDDVLEEMKERIQQHRTKSIQEIDSTHIKNDTKTVKNNAYQESTNKRKVETTEEELQAFETIKQICESSGEKAENIMYKDTVNYFNISYKKPTMWFIRLFTDSKKKNITTLVPLEQVKELIQNYKIDEAPSSLGVSRIYFDNIDDIHSLSAIVIQSLQIVKR